MSNSWPENQKPQGTDPATWQDLVDPNFVETAKIIQKNGQNILRPTDQKWVHIDKPVPESRTAERMGKFIGILCFIILCLFLIGWAVSLVNWIFGMVR